MLTFQEFNDLMNGELEPLDERNLGRKGFVKVAAVALQAKVNTFSTKVKATDDLKTKIDLLSDQMKWVAGLATLAIASDLEDRTILKRITK